MNIPNELLEELVNVQDDTGSERYALVKDGVVSGVIMAFSDYIPEAGFSIVQSDTAQVGDLYGGIEDGFTRPLAPVPQEVTKLQLVRVLRKMGLKPVFDAVMAAASEDIQEDWALATSIRRLDPITIKFIDAADEYVNADLIDDAFRLASTL